MRRSPGPPSTGTAGWENGGPNGPHRFTPAPHNRSRALQKSPGEQPGGNMDGHRFDSMTRVLATGTSRRTAIRMLAGAAAGTLGLGATRAARADPTGKVGVCHRSGSGRRPRYIEV